MGNFSTCCTKPNKKNACKKRLRSKDNIEDSSPECVQVAPDGDGYNCEISGIFKQPHTYEFEGGLTFKAKSAKSMRFLCEHGVAVATRLNNLVITASQSGVFIMAKDCKGLQTLWVDGCIELRQPNPNTKEMYVAVVKSQPTYTVGDMWYFHPVANTLPVVEDSTAEEDDEIGLPVTPTPSVASCWKDSMHVTDEDDDILDRRMLEVTIQDIEDEDSVQISRTAPSSSAMEEHDSNISVVVLMIKEHGEEEEDQ